MQSETPRYWDDYEVGTKFPLGSTSFTAQEIVEFARQFDPQSFHVDAEAARDSMFGGLIASGWHVAAKLMRLFVDNYIDQRTALGSPGLDEIALAEAGAAGRHADRLGRMRRQGAVQEPARDGRHPRALARHQPEGRAGDDGEGHQHGAAEAGMKRAVKGLDHVVVMVDGIDAAEAAYRKLGFQVQPRGFHRKLGTANHLMIFDNDYFEILGIVEDTAVQRRAPRMAEGGRRARQRGAGDRRRRPRLRRLQGGGPRARCAAVLRPRRRGRGQDRARAVPHRAHPQDQHAGGRLLRLRAPDAAIRLSRRMGQASQRRARHPGRHRDRRAAGASGSPSSRSISAPGSVTARGRRAGGRYRHAAHPLPDARRTTPRAIPASRRCGRATIRRCCRCGSTASLPARRCWRRTASSRCKPDAGRLIVPPVGSRPPHPGIRER